MHSSSNHTINGDYDIRVSVDTKSMTWANSPSPTVLRKRLHLVGPPEAGQVTSVVKYLENSNFPSHDHPFGEEILVLDGVFSDEHGDWPAGTYLLNPEGFRHAPFSKKGCELFVKLRQFPGNDRKHIELNTNQLVWQSTDQVGTQEKSLYQQAPYPDETRLLRLQPNTQLNRVFPGGAEILVLDGSFHDSYGDYTQGTWIRLPVNSLLQAQTVSGCTLYCKSNHLRDLIGSKQIS